MNDYVESILRQVEPQILGSTEELRSACPSYDGLCRRGYRNRIKVASIAEIEAINRLYRERDRLNQQGGRWEIDHRVPLFKGGKHSVANLRILTYEEHRRKSASERRKGI